jgi:hypothetical protein
MTMSLLACFSCCSIISSTRGGFGCLELVILIIWICNVRVVVRLSQFCIAKQIYLWIYSSFVGKCLNGEDIKSFVFT